MKIEDLRAKLRGEGLRGGAEPLRGPNVEPLTPAEKRDTAEELWPPRIAPEDLKADFGSKSVTTIGIGPRTGGASAVGDMFVTPEGRMKICTVAGTPGT